MTLLHVFYIILTSVLCGIFLLIAYGLVPLLIDVRSLLQNILHDIEIIKDNSYTEDKEIIVTRKIKT